MFSAQKRNGNYMMEVLTNAKMVIMLQCVKYVKSTPEAYTMLYVSYLLICWGKDKRYLISSERCLSHFTLRNGIIKQDNL